MISQHPSVGYCKGHHILLEPYCIQARDESIKRPLVELQNVLTTTTLIINMEIKIEWFFDLLKTSNMFEAKILH